MPPISLSPPWNIFALIHRETLLFDPRVMAAVKEEFGITNLPEMLDGKVDVVNGGITGLWKGTQAEYDAIPTKNPTVLYVTVG